MRSASHIHKNFIGFTGIVFLLGVLWLSLLSCGQKQNVQILKIGLPEEPKTLNVWLASDANSNKILSLIYQPLYLREPETLNLVPWLAMDTPQFDPETISYTVHLKPAKWFDGSEVTSEDVAFTAGLINEFRIPRYFSKWKFIKKIETPDKYTVRFYLKKPKAIFLTRTLTAFIVSKREWMDIAREAKKKQKPLMALLNHKIEKPMGCGPFMLKEWRRGTYLYLQKNKYFFGTHRRINGQVLGPYIEDIIFKIFGTSDVAVLALKKGAIDMFWGTVQPGYLKDLEQDKKIQIFFNRKSALYFLGFNVRKPPFNNPRLRQAAAFLIDKNFIISRILQGYGTRLDSIIPPGNQYWFCPDLQVYGKNMRREARIKKAYQILKKAGYTWDEPPVDQQGNVVPGKGLHLPNGQPMKNFTILTPPADYDPHRAISGIMIQEWFRDLGMPAFAKPMSFGSLLEQIKGRHEFDAFILGYGKLSLDPDYLRSFFLSSNDKRRGWNMSGYKNSDFDRIAETSASEMNRKQRKKMIWEMQQIVMTDVPYIPIYNPYIIEAVRNDRFSGWVNMVGGIGNIWSFCKIKPIGKQ